jgi:serine/threonine protein kinase
MAEKPSEQSIFLHAVALASPADRAAYLEDVCRNNPRLRVELDALLAAHDRLGADPPPCGPELPQTINEPTTERPGAVIGPFKLLEQIGEGGFGIVFMAEQTQPVRRKVALKVLKPGMDTRQVIARFEAERQALAIMDHPNIAKVYDGGTTPSGRPYFVMELVKGVPITDFCDQNHLTPRERLKLFVSCCEAVQHAHQKGIIHRDLKPTNVLVAAHDGAPLVKIIDFGVAKALGQELTDKTLFTGFAQMIGTPLYMSPEQAGQSLDIDTRSDIYSLGVLLYELLTGTTPFTKRRFQHAAYDEIRRIIREEEPPKPSTRLSESKDSLPSISASRHIEPAKLTRLVRGELDWIVMKALEKDRGRRYETANGFAMDVQRYLRDEAVLACPPSARYRLKKFLRRHRRAVLAAGVVLLGLLIGIAGTVVGLVRAVRAEARAVLEAENARQARDAEADQNRRAQENLRLALRVLDDIYLQIAQDRVPRDTHQTRQEHELLKRALEFYQEFAAQNSADPAVALDVARARRRVGDIQRLVGQLDGARGAYLGAIDQAERLGRNFPDQPQYAQELAACHDALGELLVGTGELPAAEKHFHSAVDCLIKLSHDCSLPAGCRAELARGYHGLGLVEKQRGSRSAAEAQFQNAIKLQTKLAAEEPKQAQYRADLAQMHHSAGRWLSVGRRDSQIWQEHLRSAVQLLRGLVQDFSDVPLYRYRLAMNIEALASEGGSANAQESADILVKLIAEFPSVPEYRANLAVYHDNEGDRCWIGGQVGTAAEHYSEALQLVRKLAAEFPQVHRYQDFLMVCLSSCGQVAMVRDRDFTRASELLEQAAALARFLTATYPENQTYACHFVNIHEWWAVALAALGKNAEASRRSHEAEQAFRTALEARKKLPNGHTLAAAYCADQRSQWEWYANALMSVRGATEAASAYRRIVAIYSEGIQLDPTNADLLISRAQVYGKLQQWPGVVADCTRAIAIREKLVTDFPQVHQQVWDLAACCIDAGHLLQDNKRDNEAAKIYERARKFLEARQAQFPEQTEYRAELGRIYIHIGWLLSSSGRQSEREKAHRQALDLYEKLVQVRSTPELNRRHRTELAWTHEWLGHVLTDSNRPQEAEKAFRQAIALYEELNTEFPNQGYIGWVVKDYHNLVTLLIRQSQWDKAVAECAKTDLLARPLPEDAYAYACLLLIRGDSAGYNRFCQGMIGRAAHTEDYNDAFTLARSCTMARKSPIDPVQAVRLATKAVTGAQFGWQFHVLGLAQYRAGQFEQALQSFAKADVQYWPARDLNWFGLALVHHRLGHAVEARKYFDSGIQWMERYGSPGPVRLANIHPCDWLEAQVLRREAEETLKIKRSP